MIQVGGSRRGDRIGEVLYPRVPGEQMVTVLTALVRAIRAHKPRGMSAGDFLARTPLEELHRLIGDEGQGPSYPVASSW